MMGGGEDFSRVKIVVVVGLQYQINGLSSPFTNVFLIYSHSCHLQSVTTADIEIVMRYMEGTHGNP